MACRQPSKAKPPRPLRRFSANLVVSFHPPGGEEQLAPVRVIKLADLHHGALVCGGADEFAVADVHAGVGDPGLTEEQQVSRLKMLAFDLLRSVPSGL